MKTNFKIDYMQLLISGVVALMIICIISLSFIAKRESTLNADRDFWTISFVDPKSTSLDFSIENYSLGTNFHWSAAAGKSNAFSEGSVTIEPGEKTTITIEEPIEKKRVVIIVSSEDEQQVIYKSQNN